MNKMNKASRRSTVLTRSERLKGQNFRVPGNLELKDPASLTALIGPTGSRKSTMLGVFSLLGERFGSRQCHAREKQGGAGELKSPGTLKTLARLVLLCGPASPPLIAIDAQENSLHPRLLPMLAEVCRTAGDSTQIVVSTCSLCFTDALPSREVRVLWRDEPGYA